nr:MAG TPA: head tail adaptor [Caudoviricetes sp.]
MIGGNKAGIVQKKGRPVKNSIGAVEHTWEEMVVLTGFLDLSNGDSKHTTYNAKVQESTHIFLCDYRTIDADPEQVRMIIDGKVYEILLIDNPMELNQQLEIYLRFVGGQRYGD